MSDQEQQSTTTIFSRLGSWFRRGARDGDLPLSHQDMSLTPRSTFLRPGARRDAAIQNLHEGFTTLTDLMSAIRENMDRQGKRQDELLEYLSQLPEALRSLPENGRLQGETLRAIHQQLQQQNNQQEKLTEILEKVSDTSGDQRQAVSEIREHIESIRQTDETVSANLSNLGAALQGVSRNSTTGAQVLEQMRDRIDTRDGQLEQILHRQGTRFTTMLAVAIFLSISALVAVGVMGYLLLQKP